MKWLVRNSNVVCVCGSRYLIRRRGCGVTLGGSGAGEDNSLVADKAGGVIDGMGIAALVTGVRLAADNKEGGGQGQGEQALEVKIGAVHDVDGARLGEEQVEDIDIVQFAV